MLRFMTGVETIWPPAIRFSSVVRCSNTRRPSNTWTRPILVISNGRMPSMRRPSNSMLPLVTSPRSVRSTPEIAFRVVVLPAPLAPSRVVILPASTAIETPFSTRMTLSYTTSMLFSDSMALPGSWPAPDHSAAEVCGAPGPQGPRRGCQASQPLAASAARTFCSTSGKPWNQSPTGVSWPPLTW